MEILNVSAFQICLKLFCDIILLKVINDLIDPGEISECGFEDFEKRKMLITFDWMVPQKSHGHI